MRHIGSRSWFFLAALFLVAPLQALDAAIVLTGDVDPGDPEDWNSDTDATIGVASFGTLDVDGGSELNSDATDIGCQDGASGEVTIDGLGSMWNVGYLGVGLGGSGRLAITGGGTVSGGSADIGRESGSTGVVTVEGAGSTWTGDGTLVVGRLGEGTLRIDDGGRVAHLGGIVGLEPDSVGHVTVEGAGSTWEADGFTVGLWGEGTFDIRSGGAVTGESSSIGWEPGSFGEVTVDGVGSMWTARRLAVGSSGSGTLDITNGGTVSTDEVSIGGQGGATCAVSVHGDGSTLTAQGEVSVGGRGGTGTLDITGGGIVASWDGHIGRMPGSTGVVRVAGPGSTWTNRVELSVGELGSGTLEVTAGGVVTSDFAHVWNGGSILVDGAGSKWITEGYADIIGKHALEITGGGTVETGTGRIGAYSDSLVRVDGTGSTWTNGSLQVGDIGDGDGTLHISNGGAVRAHYATVGHGSLSTGVVTVDGAGSTWDATDEFNVGVMGNGTLVVTNGGAAKSPGAKIGQFFDSTGTVTVDGVGSTWTNSGDLFVGHYGMGTLNVTEGGAVSVAGQTFVARWDGAAGAIDFGSRGGSLDTFTLFASTAQLFGTGTVNTRGLVSDVDLMFDSTHGAHQTLTLASGPDQNVTVHLDMPDASGQLSRMGAGYLGRGSLSIREGARVDSVWGYLGFHPGSAGVATIDGAGSTWANTGGISVGLGGNGALYVVDGGTLVTRAATTDPSESRRDSASCLGEARDALGVVTVSGAGSSWTNDGDLYVGREGDGILNILDGGSVSNVAAVVGDLSSGMVTVEGAGSTWSSATLRLGHRGGALNIAGGGAVLVAGNASVATGSIVFGFGGGTMSVGGSTSVGRSSDATGSIDFGAGGGTLNTQTLLASPAELMGTGTINARGLVSDLDLVFDAAHGLVQTFTLANEPRQRVTVHLDMSGGGDGFRLLGAGYRGNGSLSIRDGVAVNSESGFIGYWRDSAGVATIEDPGSAWTTHSSFYVGHWGRGTLDVSDGGFLKVGESLFVGYSPPGKMHISGGGLVEVGDRVQIGSHSLFSIDVGKESALSVGGSIANQGTVCVVAAAGVAPGDYRPICAETWGGGGVYQGVGGVWDAVEHRLVVSAAEQGAAGVMTTIRPAVVQRLLVSHAATGWTLGASFLATPDEDTELEFTATAVDATTLVDLAELLGQGERVGGAWSFEIGGAAYEAGDPVYLSFGLDGELARTDLNVWHHDGSQWAAFDAADLSCDGRCASFTATDFSAYAVTVVPEPETMVLLLAGVVGVVWFGRRKRG